MSAILSKCVMWLAWGFFALLAVVGAIYLPVRMTNSGTQLNPVFAISMFGIPIVICASLRFWIARMRNVWLMQIPYLVGLVFAYCAEMYGIFLVPQFLHWFQVLSATLLLLYLPLFVKFLRPAAPPLPGGR